MRRQCRAALMMVVLGLTVAAPATARTKAHESFNGVIVVSGASGTRTALSSVLFARGGFEGVGRIVEVASRPGDSQDVSRDNLVFPHGTMHIVNTNKSVKLVSLDPKTCLFNVRIAQTSKVEGGAGRFRHATGSFAGTVRAWGVGARAADGSCSQDLAAILETDVIASSGSLSI